MEKRLIAYYPYWIENGTQIQDLPLERITHLHYAFADVVDGKIAYAQRETDLEKPFFTAEGGKGRGNFGQLAYVKRRYPHLKVLISIATEGGVNLSRAMATTRGRERLLTSIAAFLNEWPVFDGVDVDWEYPSRPEDRRNFTLLLQGLRQLLPPPRVLSIALGADPERLREIALAEVVALIDSATLMTYDFASIAEKVVQRSSAHNTPLYADPRGEAGANNVDLAMRNALQAGIPPQKLNMGLAFYGYVWLHCNPNQQGEYQTCCNCSGRATSISYAKILTLLQQGEVERHFNRAAQVPFLWDPQSQTFISYDDAESLHAKVGWAQRYDIGGLAIWTISQDALSFPLLRAVAQDW